MQRLISLFFATPRRTLGWVALVLAGMLAFGLYLQNVVGLQPCPIPRFYSCPLRACL